MDREFFLGFVRIHIIHHAAQKPVSGVDIREALARHGYRISPGTLYPILHRLERMGYLSKEERVEGGRRRIYYRATSQGRKTLMRAKKRIKELVEEVMGERVGDEAKSR